MAIRGPKGSHPTTRGWIDPKTGELLKSQKIPESFIAGFFGARMEEEVAPPPPAPEPVSHVMSDDTLEMHVDGGDCDCEDCDCDPYTCKMSKRELEEYGRTVGIELDRRKTKNGMLEDLKAFMNA